MKIIFPLHTTGFDLIQENEKKEADKEGEKRLCAILYLENPDKARYSYIKKHVENDYVLNKAEYPRMVIALKSILLKYKSNYSYNRNSQSNGVIN